MKEVSLMLILAMLLAGGVIAPLSTGSLAQVNVPPPNPVAAPFVGPNTPWVFYNGDWFLNGMLYYFFGNKYGWAPYYAYAPTYVVRPNYWYAPKWHAWYQARPVYWNNFHQQYPYWRGHKYGHHYDEKFYNQYHPGQGGGWHKGFHGEHGEHGEPHHPEGRR
jgi:hypothetical protein